MEFPQSTPSQDSTIKHVLGVKLTFAKLPEVGEEAALLIPGVVMTSEQEVVMPSPSHICPEYEMPSQFY